VGSHVIPPYYADFLRDNLYPNLYFRQLGTMVTVPRGYGDQIRIPRWQTPVVINAQQSSISGHLSAISARAEGGGITPQQLCAESITGAVVQFAGARGYSDKLIIVTKANFIEGALESLARELAFRLDTHTRVGVTAAATLRSVGNQQSVSGVTTGDVLRGKEIARIAPDMDSSNVPRWEDESYVGVGHPLLQYDLFTDISAQGFLLTARYNDAGRIYRGEVGRMYGIRFLLSNAVPLFRGATGSTSGVDGLSGGITGSNLYVFAPDAFYSIELEDGGVEVIHHPPGSSGSVSDPANQIGSIAVKVFYGVAHAPSGDQRLVRFAHALGLQF
jgi:N4-gp56 family major capsid protein